jgi:hypothetical protein
MSGMKSMGLLLFMFSSLAWAAFTHAGMDIQRAPHSRWSVANQDGVWWLATPSGEPFFSLGINVLTGGADEREVGGRIWYSWKMFYPSMEQWARATLGRLRQWGFNSSGAWSLSPKELRIPTLPNLELGRNAALHWNDPFHPANEARVHEEAKRLVALYRGSPYRIGYFSDNEVGWWSGALFAVYIKAKPSNHTKHRLIALLRSHYQDDWLGFCRDFVLPNAIQSFDDLARSAGVIAQLRPGGEGIQVVRKWTFLAAEQYYRLVARAIREADPEALVCGDRLPIYYDPMAVRAMVPFVDVISMNYNVDSPDGWIASYFFDGLGKLAGERPLLISEWFFAAHENRTGNRNNGHLMTVKTQAERARGAARAAEAFARQPQIVGMHWFQFWDDPKGGRADGEDYNFGLVDIDDRPYEDLVEALSRVHARAPELHREGRIAALRRDPGIPRAAIDTRDGHLGDWPKPQALQPPLVAPTPEIAFGESYLAWDERGLHMAFIGMDYQEPDLLACDGEYPLGEAFRVDWGVDAGHGPRSFSVYVIPPGKELARRDEMYNMQVRFCRFGDAACHPIPMAVVNYFGSDQPRITFEALLPWSALGGDGPPASGKIRTEVAGTAFHRSRWMSSSGLPPREAMRLSSQWRVAALND